MDAVGTDWRSDEDDYASPDRTSSIDLCNLSSNQSRFAKIRKRNDDDSFSISGDDEDIKFDKISLTETENRFYDIYRGKVKFVTWPQYRVSLASLLQSLELYFANVHS